MSQLFAGGHLVASSTAADAETENRDKYTNGASGGSAAACANGVSLVSSTTTKAAPVTAAAASE